MSRLFSAGVCKSDGFFVSGPLCLIDDILSSIYYSSEVFIWTGMSSFEMVPKSQMVSPNLTGHFERTEATGGSCPGLASRAGFPLIATAHPIPLAGTAAW